MKSLDANGCASILADWRTATAMAFLNRKTKIVATIGPASDSPEMLERLLRAGMNVARLNFSHGDFGEHAGRIARLREAEAATGCPVTIMALSLIHI
ncbi:MAG: pyruvate kinase, partial [Terrimicrobiaceae bacterium]|nr:pyruvate kinase [Terrimicrobiaceae bacterium]